jgi:hypothetical protein
VAIELWTVEAFVFRLLLLLALRKQLLCAFLSLIFLCGMMPFFVVGVLPMLEDANVKIFSLALHNEDLLEVYLVLQVALILILDREQ